MSADDFAVHVPIGLEAAHAMPLDKAIEIASEALGLPILGGPSGRGWSYYSTAQRCGHLFNVTYPLEARGSIASLLKVNADRRVPAAPLQIGGLYHTLQALYYGVGLGNATHHERGLLAEHLKVTRQGRPKRATVPPDAADQLLRKLKEMAEADITKATEGEPPRPSAAMIVEAERLFDAHTAYYGTREDVTPLAMEWLALNERMNYTCRYDMIGAVGPADPLVTSGQAQAGDVFIYERKTAAWLSEMALTGWFLDGEILGEILNWNASGCDRLFGPLKGVIVDIVAKTKIPKLHQVIVGADLPTVADHERWLRYTQGEVAMWEASGAYPKRFAQCFDKWGMCGNWHACAQREDQR